MSVRIRKRGEVVCAARYPERPGDAYLDDAEHYFLSVECRVLVTEPMELPEGVGLGGHARHGHWWWKGQAPPEAVIDSFYFS